MSRDAIIRQSPDGYEWHVILPFGRIVEFGSWHGARAFCQRQGFVPRIAKVPTTTGDAPVNRRFVPACTTLESRLTLSTPTASVPPVAPPVVTGPPLQTIAPAPLPPDPILDLVNPPDVWLLPEGTGQTAIIIVADASGLDQLVTADPQSTLA